MEWKLHMKFFLKMGQSSHQTSDHSQIELFQPKKAGHTKDKLITIFLKAFSNIKDYSI